MNIRHNPPVGFLQEETRIGYTISADMKKLWVVQMDLLQYLLDVCNKHGLRIYADGGTLLGAIRHKGYIPWDDDIDMVMLREDYDRLMALADEFEHPYFLQNVYTDSHYTHRHAQVRNSDTACWGVDQKGCTDKYNQGIFIDIFPADILPTTARGFSRYYNKETRAKQKFRFVSKLCNAMPEFIYKWMRNSTKWFSDKYVFGEYENAVRGQNPKGNAPVCEIAFNHSSPINFYEEYGEPLYADFEYIKIPIPQQSHALLERQYGADYMTPQQVSAMHGSFNFDVEKSYKQLKSNH